MTPLASSGLPGRALLVAVLLGAVSLAWSIARRRTARFRPVPRRAGRTGAARFTSAGVAGADTSLLTAKDLGVELGTRATFVQFSAQTCASCPGVHRVLAELAANEPGVNHADLPAEDRMDLVRRFSVLRTPTVLLLDGTGLVRSRSSGPLDPARALAALAQLTHDSPRSIDA